MKVKIGDKIYDSNEQPIMIILEDFDKENLLNMGEQVKYCSFPENYDIEEIKKFMQKDK